MSNTNAKYSKASLKMRRAMMRLLERKHFCEISVTEICNEAGVNRSTFYSHYDNTDDLLKETINYILDKLWNRYKGLFIKSQSFSKEHVKVFLDFIKENRNFVSMFTSNIDNSTLEDIYNNIFEDLKFMFIRYGYEDEKLMRWMFDYVLLGMNAIINKWLNNSCAESTEYMAGIIYACVKNVNHI